MTMPHQALERAVEMQIYADLIKCILALDHPLTFKSNINSQKTVKEYC